MGRGITHVVADLPRPIVSLGTRAARHSRASGQSVAGGPAEVGRWRGGSVHGHILRSVQ
jgi:hypothetical protein